MSRINWEITIANTLSVEQNGSHDIGWGHVEEVTTNWQEVELDFTPSIDYTNDFFTEGDDPDTGDERLDEEIMKIVNSF